MRIDSFDKHFYVEVSSSGVPTLGYSATKLCNIELKAIKEYKGLSDETIAFSASFYLNGKRVGTADNDGRGGCNCVRIDRSKFPDADGILETEFGRAGKSLDFVISNLVGASLDLRDVMDANRKTWLTRDSTLQARIFLIKEIIRHFKNTGEFWV